MTFPAVRREMTLAATPHTVYRAWLTPEILRQWMAPGHLDCARAEVDERVGGRFRIWHADGDQAMGGFEAEILELVPDQRLVWKWGIVGPERERGPVFDSLLTVTLDETGDGGTRLTLLHEKLDALHAAMPELAGQFSAGWGDVLEKLAVTVKQ
jgi:uncharacterized protein YndB with AHSA1/START domain